MSLLQRLRAVFVRPPADPAIAALYGACVAQARRPEFYDPLGVPDTVDGRFDLLLLHAWLVMRRLGNLRAKQGLFDLMFVDMERSLREMGVGDMSIGKKMRPMIQAFYGRAQAYEKALGDDAALEAALKRNLYGAGRADGAHARHIARYVRQSLADLDRQSPDALGAGAARFADIAAGLA